MTIEIRELVIQVEVTPTIAEPTQANPPIMTERAEQKILETLKQQLLEMLIERGQL